MVVPVEEPVVEEPAVEEPAEEEAVQEQEKPTKEGFFARLKRSLLKPKKTSVPDLSVCSAVKRSTMICLKNWKSSC